MLTTSAEWDSLVHDPLAKMSVVVRMYYGDETDATDYVALTNRKGIVIGGEPYLNLIQKIPRIQSKIKVEGDIKSLFEHSISGDSLIIDNLEYEPGTRFTDAIDDIVSGAGDIGFYNRKIEIRLFLASETNRISSWANCLAIMEEGRVRDIKHDRKKTTVPFRDHSTLAYIKVGTILTDSEAADTAEGLPEDGRGKIAPWIYGDHTYLKGDDAQSIDTVSSINNLVPLVHIGIDSAGIHRWHVSDHILNEILETAEQTQIWGIINNRFVRPYSFTTEQNTAAGAIISASASYLDYWYSKGVCVAAKVGGIPVIAFTNPTRLNDRSFTLVSTGTVGANSGEDDYSQVTVRFKAWDLAISDSSIAWVRLKYYGKIVYDVGDLDDFEILIGPAAALQDQAGFEPEGAGYPAAQISAHAASFDGDQAGILADAVIRLNKAIAAGPEAAHMDLYEAYKQIRFTSPDLLPLYFSGKGQEYGTWIDGRAVAEGFTETHADDDGSTDLIQNFAGVIESVLRDMLSLGNANIDRDAFGIASNDRPTASWKCSSSLTIQTLAKKYISELQRDCGSWFWWQPDGTAKMQVIEDTYSSSNLTIDARDVKGLKFSRTKLADLKTAANILYNYSAAINGFASITGVSEDTTCQTFYNITEAQSTLEHEARHIGDSTTAGKLRTFWLKWLMNLHNIAEGQLPRQYLNLDIGDIIEFSDMPYKVYGEDITASATRAGQTIYPYFKIFQIDRGAVLKFKAIQMHNLSA